MTEETQVVSSDDELKARVDAYVDEVWEDAVQDIRTLVQVESVEDLEHAAPGAPFGPAPAEALHRALAIADRLGLKTTDCDGYMGFGDVPGADDKCVATICHSDIVPLGLGWTVDPLDVTRRDGYLLGRGTADDKGPLVVSLYAAAFFAREVARTGKPLPHTLRAMIGANEETGMADVDYYLKHYPEPDFLFSPDADFPLICGEKGVYHGRFTSAPVAGDRIVELDGGTVANAIPGLATALVRADADALPAAEGIAVEPAGEGLVRITATGKGGHASMPEGTVNAIGVLVRYLLDQGICGEGERTFLELERTLTASTDGSTLGIAAADNKFGPLTCIAGTVRTKDGCYVQTVDSRYPTSTTGGRITTCLRALAERHGATYQMLADAVPFYIEPTSPEIRALLQTYSEYAGYDAQAFTIGGGTYARHFTRACAFGPHEQKPTPDWVGMEHGPDEGASEEDLRQALKIYIVSIARLMTLPLV